MQASSLTIYAHDALHLLMSPCQVHVLEHPIARVSLTQLRNQATRPEHFRAAMQRLSTLIFVAAAKDIALANVAVQTPLAPAPGSVFARPVVLVPILRAGLGMVDGILSLLPDATVAHLGICRDETTAQPQSYYAKLPPLLAQAEVFLLDPMLATGGSAIEAVRQLKAAGAVHVTLVGIIAAPEGVHAFTQAHPDVPVHTCAVDERLNDRAYIMPGLGDAGDRYFGT